MTKGEFLSFFLTVDLYRESHEAQAVLEPLILLLPLPKCWDYRRIFPCLARVQNSICLACLGMGWTLSSGAFASVLLFALYIDG